LIPRKVKEFFPKVATDQEVSEELVEDVVNFYWKEVKNQLIEPEHITLLLENFGTFEIRKKQIEVLIKEYKSLIKYAKPNTYNKHVLLNITIKKLATLEKVLIMCQEQEIKKKQVREIQKNGKTV